MKAYYIRMKEAFSLKFLVFLFLIQCFIKGIVFAIFTSGIFPLLKLMNLDAVQVQLYSALALSPWTIKPLFGVLSDLVAFNGYHKRYWMLGSIAAGLAGIIVMVIEIRIAILIVCMVFLVHLEISVCDLLTEGMYAELMRKHPETGSDIVTFANGAQQLGFVVAMSFTGPLADLGLFRISSIIALALSVAPIPLLVLGWLPETRRTNAPFVLLDTFRIRKEWRIIMVVALTGLSAPAMAAITALASKWLGLMCSILVLILVALGGFFAFDHKMIGRIALYQIITQASRVSFSSALDFFFTADSACLPGGPQFSFKFYITTTGIAGSVASLATAFMYQLLFSRWRFRSVLLFTSILSGVSGLFDFIIVKRWNVEYLGIPDYIFFLLGDDIIHSICDMLFWIPSSAIIGKVCPENMESCTYAFISGASNFGYMVAVMIGAILTELFGVRTVAPDCEWGNLSTLVLIGHVIIVLIVSIPASFLVPNTSQDESLIDKVTEELHSINPDDLILRQKEPSEEDFDS
jgi:hypothetical protein